MRNQPSILTAKQLRWIDEFLVDSNGAAAAIRAGYSAKCARSIAHENTTKHDIQVVLRARQAAMAKELQITRAEVVRGFMAAFEMAKADRQPSVMVSSMAAVAKMLGLYAVETEPVKLTAGQDGIYQKLAFKSDAELLTLINQSTVAAS